MAPVIAVSAWEEELISPDIAGFVYYIYYVQLAMTFLFHSETTIMTFLIQFIFVMCISNMHVKSDKFYYYSGYIQL